ncbi:hypothetical protein B0I35DRAFT_420694 [Stachybotrys elegans]|uniref:DUF7907 domain-containing protein n=1 Tax=Stachybotrys elegans TaxID=80388 RepID=A0A8K0WYN8_9HYPO|nr:hypothetical protein B0I35DRAFT_420694 [Stachybotrys elegans]
MKFFATFITLAGITAAQDVQSPPFSLVIFSKDKTLNGQNFTACHTGAAIESLCLGYSGSEFYLNTTEGGQSALPSYTQSGPLIWNLPIGDDHVSSAMQFYIEPSTNVANLLFEPGYTSQYVAFKKTTGEMAIISYLDDTVTPPVDGKAKPLTRWVVCTTNYLGYTYRTLNWVLGSKPQNPSCVHVGVKRVPV